MKMVWCLLLVLAPASVRAQQDAFDLAAASIVNAPDVRAWPITTALTAMSFDGSVTRVNFTKKDGPARWPDVTPAGWTGPLEYTLWLFVQVDGTWVGSGFIQFWNGRDGSGSAGDPDVPTLYAKNWYYAARWAPIFGHGPIVPGEIIGFLVTSGNARDGVGPYGPRERSNVVVLPATDRGSFDFPATGIPPPVVVPPVVVPPVVIPPPVVVPPAPIPSTDLSLLLSKLDQCVAAIALVDRNVTEGRTENRTFFETVRGEWKRILAMVGPAAAAWIAGRKL